MKVLRGFESLSLRQFSRSPSKRGDVSLGERSFATRRSAVDPAHLHHDPEAGVVIRPRLFSVGPARAADSNGGTMTRSPRFSTVRGRSRALIAAHAARVGSGGSPWPEPPSARSPHRRSVGEGFLKAVEGPKGAEHPDLPDGRRRGRRARSRTNSAARSTVSRRAASGTPNSATTALSPGRAALLRSTINGRHGRHHGIGSVSQLADEELRTFAEVLRENGYSTAWFGKNHNVPDWQQPGGPFDLWPTGLGFEYFYGFIGGDTNQ